MQINDAVADLLFHSHWSSPSFSHVLRWCSSTRQQGHESNSAAILVPPHKVTGYAAAHCKLISDAALLVYSTCPAIKRSGPRGNISSLMPCKVIKGNKLVACLLHLPGLINPFSVTFLGEEEREFQCSQVSSNC